MSIRYTLDTASVLWDGGTGYGIVSGDFEVPPGWTLLDDVDAQAYFDLIDANYAATDVLIAQWAAESATQEAGRKAAAQSAYGKLVALGLSSYEATVITGYDPDDDGDGPGDGDGDGDN